jgi:protein-S-isoprenylcysteine O-methyltransferase Ste14
MFWLWLRSVFYVALVGGIWLVVIPLFLVQCDPLSPAFRFRSWFCVGVGAGLFSLGAGLALWSGSKLIQHGNGTPFPLDPTRRLVIAGPYRVVRNPQGIALMLLTLGEALIVDAPALWLLPLLAGLFLIGVAEPFEDWEMQRRFGRRYDRYRSRVRRWLPGYIARSCGRRIVTVGHFRDIPESTSG